MSNEPMTYKNQPNNLVCWRLGMACRQAASVQTCGDYIDRGLLLLRELGIEGYGIVELPKKQKTRKRT